jgi:hypothetical protein
LTFLVIDLWFSKALEINSPSGLYQFASPNQKISRCSFNNAFSQHHARDLDRAPRRLRHGCMLSPSLSHASRTNSIQLPIDDADNTKLTNVTTTANGQFPTALLDLPDSADLLTRTLWKPDPDVTCDPEGWVRNEPRWYSWSVHEVEKEKGKVTLYGKKCVRLACYREAAAYVCNMASTKLPTQLTLQCETRNFWR